MSAKSNSIRLITLEEANQALELELKILTKERLNYLSNLLIKD